MSESRLRIGPEIVHETVDGEVIAIHLGDGSYYSLAGSGSEIWRLLAGGASEAEVVDALVARHGVDGTEIAAGVSRFLAQLEEHRLAVRGDGDGASAPAPGAPEDGAPYEEPRLERYTDMKDYFLLDPIHEVNPEAGWPRPAGD